MRLPNLKVEWRAKEDGTSWVDISGDVDSSQSTKTINAQVGTAMVKIKNTHFKYSKSGSLTHMKQHDEVKVSIGGQGREVLKFLGNADEINYTSDSNGRYVNLKCVDKTRRLFAYLDYFPFTNRTPAFMIKNMVDTAQSGVIADNFPKFKIWAMLEGATPIVDDDGRTHNGHLMEHDSNGDAFEAIPRKSFAYLRLYENILTLCAEDFTGDGAYVFYLDENDDLHWEPKGLTTNDIAINELNANVVSISGTQGIFNKVTSLDIDAGKTTTGNTIFSVVYDGSKIVENGGEAIYDYKRWGNIIAEAWKTNVPEPTYGTGIFIAMPVTGDSVNGMSSGSVVTSTADYNASLRTQSLWESEVRGHSYINRMWGGTWKMSVKLTGNNNYSVGDLVLITSDTLGVENYEMYAVDVKDDFSKDGWNTTLKLEEKPEFAGTDV